MFIRLLRQISFWVGMQELSVLLYKSIALQIISCLLLNIIIVKPFLILTNYS